MVVKSTGSNFWIFLKVVEYTESVIGLPMQTEKSQPVAKRIIPETRFTNFRHFPLTRGLDFSSDTEK